MANGNGNPVKLPGFMFGGGVALSNTTILILGALGLGAMYLHFDRMGRKYNAGKIISAEMDPKNIEAKIESDVMANAAQVDSVINNQDRVREAVGRQKSRIKELRDNYRDGVISRDEYILEIRAIWTQVAEELEIPIKNPELIPEINKGHRGGTWRKRYGMIGSRGWKHGYGALVSDFMPAATAPHVANHAMAGPVYSQRGQFLGFH
jgi:hypothetical protein